MIIKPYVCYPIQNEPRPLILDIDVGQHFLANKAVVYIGRRSGGTYKPQVVISKQGSKPRLKTVSRFILNPPKYQYMYHKNGNGFDCRRSNLECLTSEELVQRRNYSGLHRYLSQLNWTLP